MPRQPTDRIQMIKQELLNRLEHGFYRPGDRFLSNRALANRFGISYQTAHRLIVELMASGRIERRHGSGTYVAGPSLAPKEALLVFHPRSEIAGTFGARLLQLMAGALNQRGLAWRRVADLAEGATEEDKREAVYPVCWDHRGLALEFAGQKRFSLLLHDQPPPGLQGLFIDSVSVDDYSGGVCAAELMRQQGVTRGVTVLAGPVEDPRSTARVHGFRSLFPNARVIHAPGWLLEDGLRMADSVIATKAQASFCANDRLAQALIQTLEKRGAPRPLVIGFDDAPVAAELGLTTVAIPWDEMAAAAARLVQQRLTGDASNAHRIALAPRPVIRG